MEVQILNANDLERHYSKHHSIRFPSRLSLQRIHVRLNEVRFDFPGDFLILLLIDGEMVGDAVLHLVRAEEE